MPNTPKIVTRESTTSTVTADNLNKGSALTAAEMDGNIINLRDSFGTLSIDGNTLLPVSTNDDLTLTSNGTGEVVITNATIGTYDEGSAVGVWGTSGNNRDTKLRFQNTAIGSASAQYALARHADFKLSGTFSSGSSLNRQRVLDTISLDTAGSSMTSTSGAAGPQFAHWMDIFNSDGGNASTIGNIGNNFTVRPDGSGSQSSTINITNCDINKSNFFEDLDTGDTVNITNLRYFRSLPSYSGTSGTISITNEYGLFVGSGSQATNKYGVYVDNDGYSNKIGGVRLLNEDIRAFTSGDDLTISNNGTGHITIGSEITVEDDSRIQIGASNSIVIDTGDDISIGTNAIKVDNGDQKVTQIRPKTHQLATTSQVINIDIANGLKQYVSLTDAAEFVVKNLSQGEYLDLFINNTGAYSVTFYNEASTSIAFNGGQPSLTSNLNKVRFENVDGYGMVGIVTTDIRT